MCLQYHTLGENIPSVLLLTSHPKHMHEAGEIMNKLQKNSCISLFYLLNWSLVWGILWLWLNKVEVLQWWDVEEPTQGIQSYAIQLCRVHNQQERGRHSQPHLSVKADGASGDVDPSSVGKSRLVGHYHWVSQAIIGRIESLVQLQPVLTVVAKGLLLKVSCSHSYCLHLRMPELTVAGWSQEIPA